MMSFFTRNGSVVRAPPFLAFALKMREMGS